MILNVCDLRRFSIYIYSFRVHLFLLIWPISFDFGPLLPVLSLSDRLALLQCFHVLLPWRCSFCLLQVGLILFFGEFGGASSSFPRVVFSGGDLVFVGPGGGGALLLLFSAVFIACAIASPSVFRCACRRSSASSCFLSRSSTFFSFALRFLRSLVSACLVFSSSFSSSVIRLSSSSFFSSASRILFSCWGFLGSLREVFVSVLALEHGSSPFPLLLSSVFSCRS